MDRREIRTKIGEVCLELTVLFHVGGDDGLAQGGG